MDRELAIYLLMDNITRQNYHPEKHFQNVVNFEGKYLAPYVPYIGKSYFESEPRLLIYGMAQNLCRHESSHLVKSWMSKPDKGIRRLYYNAPRMNMLLWDKGNLKVIAALAMNSWPNTTFNATEDVYDLVAVANFVKFSFYQEKNGKRVDINPPKAIYDAMWQHYCRHEISILKPSVIIGCGKVVADATSEKLGAEANNVVFVPIVFPFGRPLPNYIKDGNQLREQEHYNHNNEIGRLNALMQGTPDQNDAIHKTIRTNWNYFREMQLRVEKAYKSRTQ